MEKRVVFLEGRMTILRPMDKATDMEPVLRWINDPNNRQYVLSYLPQGRRAEEEWFDKQGKSDTDIVLGIVAKPEMRLIGMMGIHRISWKDGTAFTGALIGDSAYWGKGYGTDAKMTLLEYAFNELGLRRVCSSVIAFNKRSLAYSLHCGYRVEGTQKAHIFKRGRHRDLILLAVFKRDWLPIWRRWKKTGSVRE